MAALDLQQIGVDFPLFFAGDRSFKRNLLGAAAGRTAAHPTTVQALHDLTLAVGPDTRLALLGGNAAGKTTLLRVMAGLLEPSTGRAQVTGRPIGLLGTGIGIDTAFTARQTIIGQGLLMGFTAAQCRVRVADAAAFGELDDVLDLPLSTLGQGHQVRVALGLAVAYEADILLIDEMLEHLAPSFIDRLCHHIDCGMPKGSIVVVAERSRSLLDRICTGAALLNQGQLVDQGSLAEIAARHHAHLTR